MLFHKLLNYLQVIHRPIIISYIFLLLNYINIHTECYFLKIYVTLR